MASVDLASAVANYIYDEKLTTQTTAVANNSEMSMDDFWQLIAAQLRYQDMNDPMSNSDMMNQMTSMASMNSMSQMAEAVTNLAAVTNNQSVVTLTAYSTGLLGKEVTVALKDEKGEVTGEKKGTVTGVDLTGAQYVYIDGEKYELSQVMAVGDIPKKEEEA